MVNLIIEKNINTYIRKTLNMSVSKDLKYKINEKVITIIEDAKQRAELEGRRTILKRHI